MKIDLMNFCLIGFLALALAGCGGPSPDEVLTEFATGVVKRDQTLFYKHIYFDRKAKREMDANPEISKMVFDKLAEDDGVMRMMKVILESKLTVVGESSVKRTIRAVPKDPKRRKELKDEGCRGISVKARNVDGEWKIDLETIAPIPVPDL